VAGRAEPGAQGRLLRTVREIRTPRLRLRPFAPEHEAGLEALWNDPEVRRFLWDDEPVPSSVVREQIEACRRSFRERGFGHFAFWPLAAPADPASIAGFAGLRAFGANQEIELLYAVRPALGRRGLATEAAGAVLRFGFDEAGLAEILAGADPPNAASFRVMERLGMSFLRDETIDGRAARYYRLGRAEFERQSGYTIDIQEVP
jgi:RimJ/RimL family protein N-acetyltransferase